MKDFKEKIKIDREKRVGIKIIDSGVVSGEWHVEVVILIGDKESNHKEKWVLNLEDATDQDRKALKHMADITIQKYKAQMIVDQHKNLSYYQNG